MEVKFKPAKIKGEVQIPGSKSHTIRALIIATLAKGQSRLAYPLDSQDTQACVNACRLLGAEIDQQDDLWTVKGTDGQLKVPDNVIDVANSGTTLYIAMSMAALLKGHTVFTGDHQIRNRTAENLLKALNDLGAEAYSTRGNGCAPLIIRGPMQGGVTELDCPTSQYLSSLLIAAPLAQKTTTLNIVRLFEKPYVEITLNWLDSQGIKYENRDFKQFVIPGNQSYKAFDRPIAADFSSATFFLCAAAITGQSLVIKGLDMNDSQGDKGVIDILKAMGCDIQIQDDSLVITGKELHGGDFDLNAMPDSLPALSMTACFAKGKTRFYNVSQARIKETDRIAVMAQELTKMGGKVKEREDGLEIEYSPLKGARVHGHYDHRVVMSLSIASLVASGETTIDTAEAANVTFPQFFPLFESIKV